MTINTGNIPDELKALPQWVCWKYTIKENGDKTKTPVNARTLANASSTNPADWVTFEKALNVWQNTPDIEGIGFVFTEECGYVGVDFDDCITFEALTGRNIFRGTEQGYLRLLGSYAEISPSGTGFKVIFKGSIPEEVSRRGFGKGNGIYSSGRYFTITGNVVHGYTTINETPADRLEAFLSAVFPKQERGSATWEATGEVLTDAEVIRACERSANGEKFKALYRGDWEEAGDYGSQSEADAALCSMLAFFTGPNPAQVDRLFRASGLLREKWDTQRGASTYGENTVEYAVDSAEVFYTPKPGNVTHYAPVTTGGQESQEAPEDAPKAPSRKEAKKAWKKMMEGYPALTRAEMPLWLSALVEHLEPLGKCFASDWLEMSAIGFYSALWGGKKFENLPLNIWTLGISRQGTGKSVVADELDAISHRVNHLLGNPPLLKYSSGSAAGLIRRLEGRGKPALAYFSEWTGFAKGMDADHSSNMREVLMDLYDGRSIYHQLASETISAFDPFLVINGLTTPTSWARTADASDVSNGLYSRFLLMMPDVRGTSFVHRGNEEREILAKVLADHIESLPTFTRCIFQAGTEGPECYRKYKREELKLESDSDELFDMDDSLLLTDEDNLPTGRQAARVKKMAAVLELLEAKPQIKHDTLFVRDSNVALAIRLVQRGAAYTVRAFNLLSRSRDEMEAAKVRRAIEKYKSLSIMGILRATGLNKAEAQRSLDMLMDEAVVLSSVESGRRMYFMGAGE